ncbi:MAG: TIGR02300 family protein [Rhizomicrobium sp.]
MEDNRFDRPPFSWQTTRPFANGVHAGSMTLVKADLGTKRICPSCSARFYDLQKRPIECPKCSFAFEPEALYKQRRPRQPEPQPAVVVQERDEDETEEEVEESEDAEAEEEEAIVEEPVLVVADEEEEEAAEEETLEDAGMSVVEGDAEIADIEDIDEEVLEEEDEDEALLEEVEEEEDDVTGIIDPGIGKDER